MRHFVDWRLGLKKADDADVDIDFDAEGFGEFDG